jgi:hypothetical protein
MHVCVRAAVSELFSCAEGSRAGQWLEATMRWTHCFGLIGVAMLASACEPREDSRTEIAVPVWSEDDEMIVAVVDEWTASSDPECKSSCGTCRGIQPGQSFSIAVQKGIGGEAWVLAEGGEGFVGEYYLMRDRGYVVGNVTRPFDEWGGEKLTVEAWDVSTGEHSVLYDETRTGCLLDGAVPSPDGTRIAIVEQCFEYGTRVQVIDELGEVLIEPLTLDPVDEVLAPENARWDDEGNLYVQATWSSSPLAYEILDSATVRVVDLPDCGAATASGRVAADGTILCGGEDESNPAVVCDGAGTPSVQLQSFTCK